MSYFRDVRMRLGANAKRLLRPTVTHDASAAATDDFIGHLGEDSIAQLERLAQMFPSMGGKEIGPFLRKLAREAPSNTAIVEVGSWLGAGTAQLAIGVRERGEDRSVTIYTYDRWVASAQEVEKASRKIGLTLYKNQDTLPWVMESLRPFGAPIKFIKGDIGSVDWAAGPISVYVDDAAKAPARFYQMLRTFGPSWIPGVTILVLMDYHYWEKTGSEDHKCQKYFIESHARHFTQIDDFRRASNAAFLYREKLDFGQVDFNTLLPPSKL